ncbi:hypothetical protein L1987_45561 [Smallanthus sonchifolius]|uniref:Uncharacterized protein n=1 Tax=Smallanthus sonchifolius TaxID=185202 RepID=A0ACB9FXB9_9ASTR|nr:hypothetical protein L1987_45561 [Smallanthus sonchifolius]
MYQKNEDCRLRRLQIEKDLSSSSCTALDQQQIPFLSFWMNGAWKVLRKYHLLLSLNLQKSLLMATSVDVNTEVGVIIDIRLKELRLYTDYGHCSRPLFIVEKQKLLIKKKDILALQQRESVEECGWHDLVAKGFIEYVDTEEEETTMISMTINV